MKAANTLLVLALLISLKSLGQDSIDSLPPIYEIRVDSAVNKLPIKYRQKLEDKGDRLSIEDVLKPENAKKFHFDNSDTTGMGFSSVKDYWFRIRLKNLTGKDQGLVFAAGVMRYDFHVFRSNGKREHLKSGWGVPFSERDSIKSKNAALIRIANNEEVTLYVNVHLWGYDLYNRPLNFGFSFYEDYVAKEFHSKSKFDGDSRTAFVAGIMFFSFILNIFFFRIVREKVYLYYALLMLFEAYWLWGVTTPVIFRNSPLLGVFGDIIFGNLLAFLSVWLFVRHFLKTFKHYPRWDKVLKVLMIMWTVGFVATAISDFIIPFHWFRIPYLITGAIFSVFCLSLLISFFLPKKEHIPFMNLSIIAASPLLFNWAVNIGLTNIFRHLNLRNGTPIPRFVKFLNDYGNIFEMVCVGWFAVLFTWILLQKYAHLRKQFTQQALAREKERTELMELQKEELEKQVQLRTAELKQSIEDLKISQQQLIQSEKMASLGELTAGIAHEIQNPLNFVNNFSEVNNELIDEMKEELKEGKVNESIAIAENIRQNNEKISHHGKRADSIVKGMLQHSRNSSGQKELTDINALADECMRLSYHGLRAKDKTFNAKTEMDLDSSIPKVNIASQDIGRVMLNLFTNAFYSVMKKENELGDARLNDSVGQGYVPLVSVKTRQTANEVSISIQDNGNGVPQKVIDKIFQPFFTTKPVGEGTGLGLSMSYEIVTKGHGGNLTVNTSEGEYAVFTIVLPLDNRS